MRKCLLLAAVLLGFVGLVAVERGVGDEQVGAKKAAAESKGNDGDDKVLKGRLPNYYGQLGIEFAQRQNIYRLQAEYDGRIDKLADEIAALKMERDTAIRAVLTDEQKKQYDQLVEKARQKRAARQKNSTGN